jgi:hypothetical protein
MNEYIALAGRIRGELSDLNRAVSHSLEVGHKAKTSGDDAYWEAVALNMHGYYSGVEHVFEDIARTIEDSIPSGANWHTELLTQMSKEIKGVRPPVISQSTQAVLDDFRALRHIIRNVYAFNLTPARLNELLILLPKCFDSTQSDFLKFIQFLESV